MSDQGTIEIFNPSFATTTTGPVRSRRSSARKRKSTASASASAPAAATPATTVPIPSVQPLEYQRPKYRRTIQPHRNVALQQVAPAPDPAPASDFFYHIPEPSPVVPVAPPETPQEAAPPLDFFMQTADLDQLRTAHSNQVYESKLLDASASTAQALSQSPVTPGLYQAPMRRIIHSKFFRQVGFLKEEQKIKILIPGEDDKNAWKRRLEDWLRVDLVDMKKELIDANIIKHGSSARDQTIRTLYMAMKRVGSVKNRNLSTQWHNYHRKFDEDASSPASTFMSTAAANSRNECMRPQVEVLNESSP